MGPGDRVAAGDALAHDLGRQRKPVALTAVDLPGARVEEEEPVEVGSVARERPAAGAEGEIRALRLGRPSWR
jgi:hypothetical protein